MSNRNAQFQRRPTSLSNENEPRSKTATSSRVFSTHQERTLLIGDSIIKGINPRGFEKEIKLCARSGATIQDICDDISVSDMKSFSNVKISVGGNDCSSRADINAFEDKYNRLINLIKTANNSCVVYVCKVIPRDVDVSAFNHSIQRLAEQWVTRQVYCIQDTFSLFFLDETECLPVDTIPGMGFTCLILELRDSWMRLTEMWTLSVILICVCIKEPILIIKGL